MEKESKELQLIENCKTLMAAIMKAKPNSLKGKSYIQRANGHIEKVNGYFISRGKRIYPGDTIVVPEDLNPSDVNIQGLITDVLSVLTNLVAILAIVDNTTD